MKGYLMSHGNIRIEVTACVVIATQSGVIKSAVPFEELPK